MNSMVILKLPRAAVLQILDGLQYRLEIWRRYTEEYMETGYVHEPYEVEECSSPEEAKQIDINPPDKPVGFRFGILTHRINRWAFGYDGLHIGLPYLTGFHRNNSEY